MEGLTEGRIVHFVMDIGKYKGEHRAAIVCNVWRVNGKPQENGLVQLQVFTDSDREGKFNDQVACPYWRTSVTFSQEPMPGTWHWIEKA